MTNKGLEEEPQSLPDDLGSIDTYVQEEPEGTLYKDATATGDGDEGARREDPEGTTGGTAGDNQDTNDGGTPQAKPEQQLYETPGFKEYQSKTDARIAELSTQVEQGNKARQEQQTQANAAVLDDTVQRWKQQQYEALMARGVEEPMAAEIAESQGNLAKQSYLANKGQTTAETATSTAQGQVADQVRSARAYELAAQHQVPFAELSAIQDPSYMEAHAKNLARVAKLEKQIADGTPGTTFDTSNPETAVAPSDDERILDAYAAGDARVSKEMVEAASKRMGLSIF
jgi:hypothetical protein